MTCYAVIDTNVLVSALLSGSSSSATVLIIGLMIKGEITPVYSTEIMNEYRDVLARYERSAFLRSCDGKAR